MTLNKITFTTILLIMLTIGVAIGILGCNIDLFGGGDDKENGAEFEPDSGDVIEPAETFTAFQTAVKAGDIDSAVGLFTDRSKERYRASIDDLLAKGKLQAWAEAFDQPELVSMTDSTALVTVRRNVNNAVLTVEIYFVKEDGVWRIDRM